MRRRSQQQAIDSACSVVFGANTLMRIGQPELVVRHVSAHRPIGIAPPAAPHQQDRFTLDGRFQFDSSEGAAVWTRFRDPNGDPTIRTHESSYYCFLRSGVCGSS
jgi:hypothetical protein